MTALSFSLASNPRLSQWIQVGPDGRITVFSGKVELGQGVVTAIAAIAADELCVELEQIEVVAGDTQVAPNEGYTAGSLSIQHGGEAVRWVSAAVRELFTNVAAERLGVGPERVRVEGGEFFAPEQNKGLGYGDLATSVDLEIDVNKLSTPTFVSSGDRPNLSRIDLPKKLSGSAFIHDITVPEMHHGRVLRPAYPNARLRSLDRSAIETLPGVVAVVVDGNFIGIVAQREDQVDAALRRAERCAKWDRTEELPPYDGTQAWMETVEPSSVIEVVRDGREKGTKAASSHEAVYSRPYLAHASMAPACALAQWKDGRLHVHSHSQGVFQLRDELAVVLDMPAEDIRVTHVMGAGCYGHNGADDVALDAALLSRASGYPVLCRWTRQDELTWSPFGAAMRVRLSADLDADGQIISWCGDIYSPPHVTRPGSGEASGVNLLAAWQLEQPVEKAVPKLTPNISQGDRNAVPLYRLKGRNIRHHFLPNWPLRASAMRSLGAHCNVFAIESFMDELAVLTGRDPVEWRLSLLEDHRARAVIEAVVKDSGWDPCEEGGDGSGHGLAFAQYKNSSAYCAVVARVEISDTVRLLSVHAAVDCGRVVHRDGVLNQIEGGIIQASSWTLKEEIAWDADGLLSKDWSTYPILGFRECPAISVNILHRPEMPPLGTGECATGPTAGAIANAVHHALGIRVRHMPLTVDRIVSAIHAATN